MKSAPALRGMKPSATLKNRRITPDVRYTSHQSQPAAMSTHHLEHERSLVGGSGGVDTIDGLANSVQRGRSANRQVGHGHVVIDGPDESDYFEVPMLDSLSFRDFPCSIVEGTSELLIERRHKILPPEARSSVTRPGHSDRNTSAPVRDPSPPQTTRASIPSLIILNAA